MSKQIFISYRHLNNEIANKVFKWFERNAQPLNVWIDHENLRLYCDKNNQNFHADIRRAISESQVFIYIWTKEINSSTYCTNEFNFFRSEMEKDDNKCYFILRFDSSLRPSDYNLNLSANIESVNYIDAYNDNLFIDAMKKLKATIYKRYNMSDNVSDEEMERYIATSLKPIEISHNLLNEKLLPKININYTDKYITLDEIIEEIYMKENFQLVGPRGSGRTTILQLIYNKIIQNNKDNTNYTKFVPVLINTEPLWNEYSNYDDYLKLYSDVVGFPYTNDKKFNYIFLVDSSIGSSKGRFDEESLKELSNNYNVTFIISTEKPLVLPFNNTKLIIEPLSFAKIHNIVLQFYNNNNNNNRIADFFAALLKPTFLYSQYEFENNKSYYDLILHIYKAFNNSFDAYGHARTNEIFSLTLAKSTERKRFPSAMTDEDIEKWKRIVKRNEAFNLIRLPMNLSMALQMFELKGTIPINKKAFYSKVYTILCSRETSENNFEKICLNYLSTLHNYLEKNNTRYIDKETYRSLLSTNSFGGFNSILEKLHNCGLIKIANNEIYFGYDFIYELYDGWNGKGEELIRLEQKLRVDTDKIETTFMDLLKIDNSDSANDSKYRDSLEIAVDIYLDEILADRRLLNSYENEIKRIFSERLNTAKKTNRIYQIASLYRGISRLFPEEYNLLLKDEITKFNNSDKFIKYKIGHKELFICKNLVSVADFKEFYKDGKGYYKEKDYLWSDQRRNLLISSESNRKIYRHSPIDPDEGGYCHYNINNHPIVGVNWYETEAYCNWLTEYLKMELQSDDYYVSLLTKNEYELLFKEVPISIDSINSASKNDFGRTTAVSMFDEDNKISDLYGNVWEWCNNGYFYDNDKISYCAGSAWDRKIDQNRLITTYPSQYSNNNIGFRIVIRRKQDSIKINVKNEVDPLKVVLMARVSNFELHEPINNTQQYYYKNNPPIKEILIKQQNQFVKTLEDNGVRVVWVPMRKDSTNQINTRDVGFSIGNTFVISKMKEKIRSNEHIALREVVENFTDTKVYCPKQGVIEGGDIVLNNDKIYVGISQRTNMVGYEWLKRNYSDEFEIIPIYLNEGFLHLDVVFNIVSDKYALVYKKGIKTESIEKITSTFTVIFIDDDEQMNLATNVFSINENKIVIDKRNKKLSAELQKIGKEVIELEFDEITKIGGSFRCSTCPLIRGEK